MTFLRTGKQRGKHPVPAMLQFRVGWRAYKRNKQGEPLLIAVGRDVFMALSVENAMRIACKQVPHMISAPGAEIGIRYVRKYDKSKDAYV